MQYPLRSIDTLNPYRTATQLFGQNGHTGVDWDTPNNPPYENYRPISPGRVLKVAYDPDTHDGKKHYGWYMDIEHFDGSYSRGAHFLERPYFNQGQLVYRSDQVATCGNTGTSTGHHLHFELFTSGTNYFLRRRVDPILFIQARLTTPMAFPQNNYLYQLVEGSGGFGLGLNGVLLVDDTAKILASFTMRTGGDTKGKTQAVTLAVWNSVPHKNLKGEPV